MKVLPLCVVCTIFFTTILLGEGTLNAQVTIGSLKEAMPGALLELNENKVDASGKILTSKGLGLPRVQLTAKRELFPMFSPSDNDYNTAAKKTKQDNLHTGMIVYATDVFELENCPGIYVWDGTEWQALTPREEEVLSSFTDGEGNTYEYKQYGNLYWMTQNVRSITIKGQGVTPLPKGNYPTGGQKSPLAGLMKVQGTDKSTQRIEVTSRADIDAQPDISYMSNGVVTTESFDDYLSKFGLLYTYSQAAQACPDGWRVPTVTDWNNLEKAIGEMLGVGPVVGNYEVYKAIRYPAASIGVIGANPIPWGGFDVCNEPQKDVKFNAIPVGAIYNTTEIWMTGIGAYFWTSTSPTAGTYSRVAVREESETGDKKIVFQDVRSDDFGYSLRCVKPAS